MADIKNYYYLKVKDNFYESEEMILLQNMQDGYLYSDILMKLYLRSLKNQGKLMFKDVIPYSPELLAQVVRHQLGTVKQALQIFQNLGLIEILDNGAIYMLDIQNFIGKSSTEADRKREYRMQIDAEKERQRQLSGQMSDKTTPKIEIENIDIDIDNRNNIYAQKFEKFWKAYPKKTGKDKSKKWFEKNKPDEELFELMMKQLERFKDTEDWKKQGGQYIPYPTSWLNGKRWEDEFETDTEIEIRIEKEIIEGTYGIKGC